MDKSIFYRSIPKVDVLLEDEKFRQMIARLDSDTVMDAIHVEMDKLADI